MNCDLQIRPIEHPLAIQAVRQWHYSRTCTTSMGKYGVYEDGEFVGAVLFSQGAASCIGRPFALPGNEVHELVRVALGQHVYPTTRIVSIAVRLFKKDFPNTKILVSFADSAQGHVGTIYQAMNWVYLGAKQYHVIRVNGINVHPKSLYSKYGRGGQSIPWLRANVDPKAERIKTPEKHKYIWVYDSELRRHWESKALPYPRALSAESGTSGNQPLGGGANPTNALSRNDD